jgi:putative transposase
MRRARLKVAEDREVGYYHCLSRVVERRFILEEVEKEHFVALMRECEAFCEVAVLTYCVMSNHFHILVEVPRRPEKLPGAEEMVAKLRRLSGHQNVGAVEQRCQMYREAKDEAGEAAYLGGFHARMWDVSGFMKLLKQRFTQWYNGRTGYIDLNPVRAGMVRDPKDYRWSGYGEAMAGRRRAQEGLRKVAGALRHGVTGSFGEALEVYRMHLYTAGSEEGESLDAEGRAVRGALSREAVTEVMKQKGRVPMASFLRCRVRYFCDGAVLGSKDFVEGLFRQYRDRFGPNRRSGARRLKGLAGEGLYALRDLRLGVFG